MSRERKQWAPNPYAIARALSGGENIQFLYSADGEHADRWLNNALELGRTKQTLTGALKQFRKLAAQIKTPLPLNQALESEPVKSLGYRPEQLARALPLLLQITDVKLQVSAAGPRPEAQLILGVFGESRDLMKNGAHYLDPIQGDSADCYLISSVISLAWTRQVMLEARLNASGFGPNTSTFSWRFHNDDQQGTPGPQVQVTDVVPKDQGKPLFAHSFDQQEYWPSLVEKAYLRMKRPGNGEPTVEDYRSLDNGALPQDACQSLVGGTTHTEPLFTNAVQQIIFSQGENLLGTASGVMNKPVMAWTEEIEDETDDVEGDDETVWQKTGIWPDHAYSVLGVLPAGNFTHVVLRNPYGIANETRPGYATGTWAAGNEVVELNKRGVFAIARELFFERFMHIGWVDG